MRLKPYRAASMVEAMALVRDELGAEALILGSRRIAGGVEITVAVEPADQPPPPPLVPSAVAAIAAEAAAASDPAPDAGPLAESARDTGLRPGAAPNAGGLADLTREARAAAQVDTPKAIIAPIVADAAADTASTETPLDPARRAILEFHAIPEDLYAALGSGPLDAALAATLPFGTLALAPGDRPVLLVGPPGAGKTLTTARLATRLLMAGVSPVVITADGRRAGATEQLAAFTKLLGINLTVASHPVTLGRALSRRQDHAPVLIDSPGTDPFDPAQIAEMRSLAAAAGAAIALVLPAGLDAAESADLAQAYAEAGASLLIGTRLDLARRLGGLLAAAAAARLPLAEAGIGPGAADGLIALTPSELATRLMHMPTRTGLSDHGRHAA